LVDASLYLKKEDAVAELLAEVNIELLHYKVVFEILVLFQVHLVFLARSVACT